jgi:hypothetical protein
MDGTLIWRLNKRITYSMSRNHTQISHPNNWLLWIIVQDADVGKFTLKVQSGFSYQCSELQALYDLHIKYFTTPFAEFIE